MPFYLTPNKTTSTKNCKSAWLLPEYVNPCYSVAKVVFCNWQVMEDAPAWKNNH